jgi:putative membrane protein insertion efficiency factor
MCDSPAKATSDLQSGSVGAGELQADPAAPAAGARMVVFLLALYKAFLSPVLPSSCKFYPSCSVYAQEAVARHGVVRGTGLAVRRLLRCRPFSAGGYDPVPDA